MAPNTEPRKGAGRPPKSEAGAANAYLHMRIPAAIKARAEAVAQARGISLSRLIIEHLETLS
jgi:predicted HicB family RNase H-like nuclease